MGPTAPFVAACDSVTSKTGYVTPGRKPFRVGPTYFNWSWIHPTACKTSYLLHDFSNLNSYLFSYLFYFISYLFSPYLELPPKSSPFLTVTPGDSCLWALSDSALTKHLPFSILLPHTAVFFLSLSNASYFHHQQHFPNHMACFLAFSWLSDSQMTKSTV